jgi:hypothetical protein
MSMNAQQVDSLADEAGIVLAPNTTQNLVDILHSQHALMGIFGNAFQRNGGEDWLTEWAAENPSKFFMMITRMVPNLAPTQGLQGDINIRISSDLPRSALDD